MDWFCDLAGLPNDWPEVVRDGIAVEGDALVIRATGKRMVAGRLTLPRLSDLPAPPTGAPRIKLRDVVADVQALHADPANPGAVFQVASQFNLLEMVGPSVTPDQGIAGYAHDRTQGPACAIACAAGTIFRNYLVPLGGQTGQTAGRQLDTLADLGAALGNTSATLWQMRNGYALPRPGGLVKVSAQIAAQDRLTLKGLVRVGWQADTQVTLGSAAHLVHQVYASALPIAYAREPVPDWEPFARLVLEASYEATLAIAAQTERRLVFLTRLGGGAFGNPAQWITDAIATALDRHAASDLNVVLVSYGRPDPSNRPLLAR